MAAKSTAESLRLPKMITEIRQQVPEGVAHGLQDKMSGPFKSRPASKASIPSTLPQRHEECGADKTTEITIPAATAASSVTPRG